MLTKNDLVQITTIVQSETRKIVESETRKIVQSETRKIVQQELKPIRKDLRRIEKKLDKSISHLDNYYAPRIKRLEEHAGLPPLHQG